MKTDVSFLIPMFLTVLLECLTAILLNIRSRRQLVLVALVNIMTNPLLHLFAGFLFRAVSADTAHAVIYGLFEPLIILLEGKIYSKGLGVSHPYRVSFIMNMVTMIGGILWTLYS